MKAGGRRETWSIQQATKADWLTSALDIKCAEPSKSQPSLYVQVTVRR
jgi:hypothetical protein